MEMKHRKWARMRKLESAYLRALHVTKRRHAHDLPYSTHRMGALWAAWARVA